MRSNRGLLQSACRPEQGGTTRNASSYRLHVRGRLSWCHRHTNFSHMRKCNASHSGTCRAMRVNGVHGLPSSQYFGSSFHAAMTSDASISPRDVFSAASWQTTQVEAHGTAPRRFGLMFSSQPTRTPNLSKPRRFRCGTGFRAGRGALYPVSWFAQATAVKQLRQLGKEL
jgi:hypothetical protein